jgi:hypothetical protein
MNKAIISSALFCLSLIPTLVGGEIPPPRHFTDPGQQRRYDQARQEAIQFDIERQRQEAIARELQRQDQRYYQPLREASIRGVENVAGRLAPPLTGPVVGPVAGATFRSAINAATHDPQYEAQKRRADEQRAREYQQYQERQRQYNAELQRRIAEDQLRRQQALRNAAQPYNNVLRQQSQQFRQQYPQPGPVYAWRNINGKMVYVRVR